MIYGYALSLIDQEFCFYLNVFNNNELERLWNLLGVNVRIYRMKLLKQMA